LEKKGVLEQYRTKQAEHPAHTLMFQMGGFYVMFEQDAYVASTVLGLKVVSRNLGEGKVPACGVPETAVMKHANALVKQGHAVAICKQMDGETDGIKNRAIENVLTPAEDAPEVSPVTDEDYAAFVAEFRRTLEQPKPEKASASTAGQRSDIAHLIVSTLAKINLDEVTPTKAWAMLYYWKEIYGPP